MVSAVSFRSFRFDVSPFSTCLVWLFVITRLLSVTGSCGASNSNPADSECVLRMIVIKEIKGHLRSHDVS